jgi:predicted acyltransferase
VQQLLEDDGDGPASLYLFHRGPMFADKRRQVNGRLVYDGPVRPVKSRLLSLDVVRGLTMAAMVIVNNPGTWQAVYPPLRHADWHGWTPTDVIFPFFLVIVGVAIPFALEPRASGVSIARIVRRSVIIFALGLVLNALYGFDPATIRIPGVLQRIAVCYLLAALLFITTGWRTQAVVAVALLAGYWAAMTLVPVPGYGAGNLGKEGNLAGWIDRALLGPHVWRASRVYDPEGILSTVPALATVLLGVLAGHWLRSRRSPAQKSAGLLAAGIAATLGGLVWSVWFPINKALWTSSYAVVTAGLALVALALCHHLIEVLGYRRWARPFAVLGMNALLLFFLSTLVAVILIRISRGGRSLHRTIFDTMFAPWAAPEIASLAYALVYLAAWWAVMWAIQRSGIRLRI